MASSNSLVLEQVEKKNEYQIAADILMRIAEEQNINTEQLARDAEEQRLAFVNRFSPEKLLAVPDNELLREMYLTQPTTKDYMMYHLEAKTDNWGSIWGGSSHKFGLFQREKDGQWINASEQVLTEEQALIYAKDIRDRLVRGARFIENTRLTYREDAEKLDELLQELFGKEYVRIWIHKYFVLLFPDKFCGAHSADLQQHVLYSCGIIPSQKRYARSAQLALIARHAGWQSHEFFSVFFMRFGNKLKKFYRLDSAIGGQSNLELWQKEGMVAIGWPKVGPLNIPDAKPDKNSLLEKLQEEDYPQDKKMASKKAGELLNFYNADSDSVFVIMAGEKPLALVDDLGEYFFHPDPQNPHCRHGKWHLCFTEKDRLPYQIEGKLTSCVELKQQENIRYLYQKYYGIEILEDDSRLNDEAKFPENKRYENPPDFQLVFSSSSPKNRIIFGAPGTGKSYHLKKDAEKLCENNAGRIERVTFHPEYSYSHFMGCYKPVSDDEGSIRYEFVPGPFLRVLVKALRSGMEGEVKPHLLVIEEINRARVSAVFGDIFQLLDRENDQYSEYEINVSNEVRAYLCKALECLPEECERIRIPGNMFIWATMNSADQGVFPMDTAFKRRWNFEYLPVEHEADALNVRIPLKPNDDISKKKTWNEIRNAINDKLSTMRINEDKLIGPYFLNPSVLAKDSYGGLLDKDTFFKAFKSKVLMYLFEDAARQRRQELFSGEYHRYSTLCSEFDKQGFHIFRDIFDDTFGEQA